ncbi:butyrophilin subfamily 1 member A1-like, partial [Polypterus senegalus]|uniref:butyrophilin subfamily 1 member A1-like n=1 Tax=Polypterus senegalus TaxID=55291 RepID=UPI0019660D3E
VGTQPSISISSTEDQQTRLECSSEKWSSRPEVTWRDMNGIDVTSQSNLTVQRNDEGLLRVSSVIPIKWEFNVFSCLMRSNTTRPAYLSKVGVYVFSPNVSGWSVVFWLSMALCVTATVLLILKWRRMRDKKSTYKTKDNTQRHRLVEEILQSELNKSLIKQCAVGCHNRFFICCVIPSGVTPDLLLLHLLLAAAI